MYIMPKYHCERCGKEFSQKSHYDSHKKRKKPCENYSNKIQMLVDKKVEETINDLNLTKLILKSDELNDENMETFKDLFEFLKNSKEDNIINWLQEPWAGKDKQESLLRLFAGLGLIDKLKPYDICKGNFNNKTINRHTTIQDVFYDEKKNLKNLNDKGDSSDLTGINKKDEKNLLVTTSKNINKMLVGKLDIDKIITNFGQYKEDGYTMTLCICIRNKNDFQDMQKGIEKSNKQLKLFLEKEDTIIIDWDDLNQAYHQFKLYFENELVNNIINSNKSALCLKMHQHLGVLKTLRLKNTDKKKILWGHIQRSGKSYIIGGCIIEDSKEKDVCNYLIITTAPKETIEQQRKVLDCLQLRDFNIVLLDGKNKKPVLTTKNIILCSKQFLQNKIDKGHDKQKHTLENTRSIVWLKKMTFDMRFIDESHNGGTTELAQKTLDFYGKTAFTVQITATYSKPINDYNIPRDSWILWDLDDINMCKNITKEGNIERLINKHGEDISVLITKYSNDNIIEEYSKYPELHILTEELSSDTNSKIINRNKIEGHEHDGYSMEGCFLLNEQKYIINKKTEKEPTFQCPDKVLDVFYRIFGKKIKDELGDIYDKNYPRDNIFMERIKNICNNPENKSRYIGECDFQNEPMIIMGFLPQNNIDKISTATINLLEKHNVIPDYEIISINSKTTNDPKKSIEDARIKARNSGKKGVLVLSGRQCSLGVSIDNCDIVLLLNNSMGFDMIYQMMFRCMTEGKNKNCGFVVDLNIHRVIQTSIINYASLIKPDLHPREATKFILQERLINLNADHWMPSFGNDITKITTLCDNVYNIYSSDTENALNHFLNRLRFKDILLTKEEQLIFNAMFCITKPTKKQKELLDKFMEDDEEEEKIKKGIEKTKVEKEETTDTSSEASEENEKEEKSVNYMEILKHMIPLICLLTIHDKETSFVEMFELIENNEYVYNILIDQTKSWWGKSMDTKIIKKFINLYIKYMKNDKETNQIIRNVKELFMKNINNSKQLGELIDKYLIPQELEKKSNAEVSTPFKLRQEMLDKIPIEFWTSIKKVFEPCAGKGGFIVDIIDRFMNGLEKVIPDEKERYRTIVEECLYFSDINPTNIFICKLLIDPYNEYKLNYNEGNTLELDIKEKWELDGFDADIGNPPYQNSNGASNGTLWDKFVSQSFEITKTNGYICMVHPSGWRNVNGKFKKLQKKMFEKNMLYLEIHNESDGIVTFKAETRYDWYVIQNNNNYTTTKIKFEDCKTININIRELEFIPNGQFELVQKLLAEEGDEKCEVLHSESLYEIRKKWMSKEKSDEYKYPCVYTINSKSEIKHRYSSKNNGHIGIKKFMWSNGRIKSIGSVIDKEGKYGLTQFAYGIVDEEENFENIKKAFDSNKFRRLMEYCAVCQLTVNYKIIALFKKDFWKEFL